MCGLSSLCSVVMWLTSLTFTTKSVLFKERYEDTKGAIKNGKSKIPKEQSKTVNISTGNTMAKRISTEEQATIYKILHRKLKIGHYEPH